MNGTGFLGLLLFLLSFPSENVRAQASLPAAPRQDATQLEEVVVTGRTLEAQAEAFVGSVGAAAEGRKLATWSDPLCVGAAGLAPEPARVMVDRVLDWAHSFGLRVGSPGCRPNILIVFGEDGDLTARELVRLRPLEFDAGVSGTHLGRRALRSFQNSGRPVRWWHVSLPIDPATRDPIVRVRGQDPFSTPPEITRPSDLGSYGQVVMGSRLYDESLDALQSIIIVIDAAAFERATFSQLSDYVAMLALAQIDPDTRPSAPSILGIFEAGAAQEATLSDWDRAFLQALYGTHQRNTPPHADDALIARSVARRLVKTAGEP